MRVPALAAAVKAYRSWDSGPHHDGWYDAPADQPVPHTDGFGDRPVLYDIPDELWEEYSAARARLELAEAAIDKVVEATLDGPQAGT